MSTKTLTLREFLEEKAQDRSEEERRKRREEWVAAVERLLTQFRAWLKEADPNGVLAIVPLDFTRIEEELGRYQIQGLQIILGGTEVKVNPVAGSVGSPREIRALGQVDITDGYRKYVLYRILENGVESWRIWDERRQVSTLDQSRFEEIMLDLLS